MKDNRKVAMAAVQRDGMALQYLCTLKHDLEIVTTALEQNAMAMEFAATATSIQNTRTRW